MSYKNALKAAGANILEFQSFGDWQGSWAALVEYNGERGWVQGSFGSCTHCDAFQAEFGWDDDKDEDYQQRLANFGQTYLNLLESTDYTARKFERDASWDVEAEMAGHWVRKFGAQYGVV
jgi:hypothetical protein